MATERNPNSPRTDLSWLNGNPQLHELMQRYPSHWEAVGREFLSVLERGIAQQISDYAVSARSSLDMWKTRVSRSGGNPRVIETALPHLIRNKMKLLALDQCNLAAATGRVSGKIRFNRLNGLIVQRLLFRRHLTRKPASLRWFRICWPLVTQKRYLMPLVQPRGIYCFYTRQLIDELSGLIGDRRCVEIAAGDGTLSRFLCAAGVQVRATDDWSWSHTIQFTADVEKLDAREAMHRYAPEAVVCSWPPPGNTFERHVFGTASVSLYVAIGSRYKFASGNWDAYSNQEFFDWAIDERLSRLVLPPELESAVLVFRRRK